MACQMMTSSSTTTTTMLSGLFPFFSAMAYSATALYSHEQSQFLVPKLRPPQTYHLERDRKAIQDIMHGKARLMDYDAICTFVFPDYLALAKFMYDKDGAALNSDHENFMDDSQMKMMVGDEYMLIENGDKVG